MLFLPFEAVRSTGRTIKSRKMKIYMGIEIKAEGNKTIELELTEVLKLWSIIRSIHSSTIKMFVNEQKELDVETLRERFFLPHFRISHYVGEIETAPVRLGVQVTYEVRSEERLPLDLGTRAMMDALEALLRQFEEVILND